MLGLDTSTLMLRGVGMHPWDWLLPDRSAECNSPRDPASLEKRHLVWGFYCPLMGYELLSGTSCYFSDQQQVAIIELSCVHRTTIFSGLSTWTVFNTFSLRRWAFCSSSSRHHHTVARFIFSDACSITAFKGFKSLRRCFPVAIEEFGQTPSQSRWLSLLQLPCAAGWRWGSSVSAFAWGPQLPSHLHVASSWPSSGHSLNAIPFTARLSPFLNAYFLFVPRELGLLP